MNKLTHRANQHWSGYVKSSELRIPRCSYRRIYSHIDARNYVRKIKWKLILSLLLLLWIWPWDAHFITFHVPTSMLICSLRNFVHSVHSFRIRIQNSHVIRMINLINLHLTFSEYHCFLRTQRHHLSKYKKKVEQKNWNLSPMCNCECLLSIFSRHYQ